MARLWYNDAGIADRRTFTQLYDKAMDNVISRMEKSPLQGMQWVRKVKATNMTYKESDVGTSLNLPPKNEDTDQLPWATVAPGRSKEFTLANYRLGVRVERTLDEIDMHGKVAGMISGLQHSYERKVEYLIADLFNSTTLTGADGRTLFNSSHEQEDYSYGDVYDNLEAAATLTHSAFNTMRVNMRKRTDDKGYVSPMKLDTLVVPPDLEQTALEIQKSERVPDNALNAANVWKNQFDVQVYDWLTSATAWFGVSKPAREEDNGFLFIERVAPNVAPWNTENVDILYARRLRFSLAVGATHAKRINKNAGA